MEATLETRFIEENSDNCLMVCGEALCHKISIVCEYLIRGGRRRVHGTESK